MIHTDLIVSTLSFFSQPPSLPNYCLNPGRWEAHFFLLSSLTLFPVSLSSVFPSRQEQRWSWRVGRVLSISQPTALSLNTHLMQSVGEEQITSSLSILPIGSVSPAATLQKCPRIAAFFFLPQFHLSSEWKALYGGFLIPWMHYLKWVMTQSSGIRELWKVADWAGRGDGGLNKCTH